MPRNSGCTAPMATTPTRIPASTQPCASPRMPRAAPRCGPCGRCSPARPNQRWIGVVWRRRPALNQLPPRRNVAKPVRQRWPAPSHTRVDRPTAPSDPALCPPGCAEARKKGAAGVVVAEVMSQEQSWSEALCPQKFSSALSLSSLTLTGIQEFADLCVSSWLCKPK